MGHANFCPKKLSNKTTDWEEQLSTAIHEIGHAIGFASDSMAYFRRHGSGEPLTARDGAGYPKRVTFNCPGAAGRRTVRKPNVNTLAFSLERGNRVAKVVTPTVRSVVREFFNCSTLDGAELENQHTSTGACWGSHWEERLFNTDLMSPVASKVSGRHRRRRRCRHCCCSFWLLLLHAAAAAHAVLIFVASVLISLSGLALTDAACPSSRCTQSSPLPTSRIRGGTR